METLSKTKIEVKDKQQTIEKLKKISNLFSQELLSNCGRLGEKVIFDSVFIFNVQAQKAIKALEELNLKPEIKKLENGGTHIHITTEFPKEILDSVGIKDAEMN